MRFLINDLRTGALRIADGPRPALSSRSVLIRTRASVLSAGTERMLVDFGRASLLAKASQQPERVRDVLDKARKEGVAETIAAVRSKLAQPIPLGYASAGIVIAVGSDVRGIAIGSLVASNGPHADEVAVPATFVAAVPDGVAAEHACFATLGAVGLQGIRLAGPELGERFVVTGLGVVGLLTVQLLLAQGCRVLGIDPDQRRRRLAESFGAVATGPDGAEAAAATFSNGAGVDGVLVCATTSSSDPVRAAARMCRQRGRIVLVGVTGLELERSELYEKELSIQVSASYGSGRYDPAYEAGHDLPLGLVRWTAGRNMEAVLDLMGSGRLDVATLVTHQVNFDDANRAYASLVDDPQALGIVLRHGDADIGGPPAHAPASTEDRVAVPTPGRLALVGAGNFALRTLIPAVRSAGAEIAVIVSPSGVSAQLAAERAGATAATDLDAVLDDPSLGSVFVATRHDSHAELAARCLRAGKAVYVEKPLALTTSSLDELAAVVAELAADGRLPTLTVGFNRRWAPITVHMKELLADFSAPKAIIITVNAGAIPAGHWTQDPAIGGGRIIGEACHFIDLARHLVGEPIDDVRTAWLGRVSTRDSATVSLGFADGSTATVHYLANGSGRLPKERIEVHSAGRSMVNDDFRRLRLLGWPRQRMLRPRRTDKGHDAAVRTFLAASRTGGPPPIPWPELVEVSRATIAAAQGG